MLATLILALVEGANLPLQKPILITHLLYPWYLFSITEIS